jgi:hypothetical protein
MKTGMEITNTGSRGKAKKKKEKRQQKRRYKVWIPIGIKRFFIPLSNLAHSRAA